MTGDPVAFVDGLTLRVGDRTLWEELSFRLEPGELLAVLGANGAGKTSLLRVLLGLVRPTAGRVVVDDTRIGYIPQQRAFDEQLPLRGIDLVGLGLDGHRYGLARRSRDERERVSRILATVGASSYHERRSAASPVESSNDSASRKRSSRSPASCSPTSRSRRSISARSASSSIFSTPIGVRRWRHSCS
jgi:energy-coupling factor transporter ATP-binding protein EcfA2